MLASNGWRVVVPDDQTCCGALAAHNGTGEARKLARRNAAAFSDADYVVVNAAGCGALMAGYGDLVTGADPPVRDVMASSTRRGSTTPQDRSPSAPPGRTTTPVTPSARRRSIGSPGQLLGAIGTRAREIPNGDRMLRRRRDLQRHGAGDVRTPDAEKAEAVVSTGATGVASANPGCTMQILAGVRETEHRSTSSTRSSSSTPRPPPRPPTSPAGIFREKRGLARAPGAGAVPRVLSDAQVDVEAGARPRLDGGRPRLVGCGHADDVEAERLLVPRKERELGMWSSSDPGSVPRTKPYGCGRSPPRLRRRSESWACPIELASGRFAKISTIKNMPPTSIVPATTQNPLFDRGSGSGPNSSS